MVTVSGRARQKLLEALQEHNQDPDKALRLVLAPSMEYPLGFILDYHEEADRTVESEDGVKILLVGPAVAAALSGVIIDYQDSDHGEGFTLTRVEPVN